MARTITRAGPEGGLQSWTPPRPPALGLSPRPRGRQAPQGDPARHPWRLDDRDGPGGRDGTSTTDCGLRGEPFEVPNPVEEPQEAEEA
ncbi:hypothetical protein Psi01_84790 [Planobispora siamensis]|uniref:Uncharacterized protein n=1 Tax=Planobispora siamensis TaxID=936338 RepID=A0A8J3WNZ3_9ACTN|nr:hypothetical protein Psi01_84790 [Planobispora siamensis]